MKKTFKNIRTLAALLMAGAAFTACSSDDNSIIENQQPANPSEQVYTLTIKASNGNATTRALDLDGTALKASWADGDELTVYNVTQDVALVGPLTASNASGSTADFTGTLSGPINENDKLLLTYHPITSVSEFEGQDGTLKGTNGAEKYDMATATVTVNTIPVLGEITIKETEASFTTKVAMIKLTLTDGTNAINATSLNVKAKLAGGAINADVLTFTIPAGTYTTNGGGILYFALPSAATVANQLAAKYSGAPYNLTPADALDALNDATITFTATVGGKTYTVDKTGYKFVAGKYYAATLTMTEAAPVSLIVSPAVGQVIGNDGKNYADAAAATSAGATAVAKIVYVGNDNGEAAPYDHGLALALSDASTGCYWKIEETDAGHTKQSSSTFTDEESGLQYNDATHNSDTYPAFKAAITHSPAAPTGCSAWFLASGYQWQKMADAVGGYNNLGLQEVEGYWSSTEYDASNAWGFLCVTPVYWDYGSKKNNNRVRACLAF